jgi:2-desacetyl-2-hydroxyethyl bacteriochlorophyllide A dehydrogenase
MMKAAVYEGPYQVRVKKVDIPVPQNGEALIRIKYAGICGGDIHVYRGHHPRRKSNTILSHEFVGEIAALHNEETSTLKVGDRVAVEPTLYCACCNPCRSGNYNVCETAGIYGIDKDGGMAEYIVVPLHTLYPIPGALDLAHAALIEPLAVALHAVRKSRVQAGSQTLVLGGGPIGSLVAAVCRFVGASYVAVSEVNPYRLSVLNEMGINTVNPLEADLKEFVLDGTGGQGLDVVFEAAGVEKTIEQATSLVNRQGQIIIVSIASKITVFDLQTVTYSELNVVGCRTYTSGDFKAAIDLLSSRQINVEPLISKVYPLQEADQAMKHADEGREAMKILVRP